MKIGINGFGRIGRTIAKINAQQQRFELVAINDTNTHIDNMAYLFKYDSTHGKFPGEVLAQEDSITIQGKKAQYTSYRNIQEVPWDKYNVDIVIDSSGVDSNVGGARWLIDQKKTKKVVITHSSSETDKEIIMGVNDDQLSKDDCVVSNSICDANAIAHVLKWLDEEFGILSGSITTLHPWLSYQNLVDGPAISQAKPGVVWNDYALGRGSPGGLIPKNTTAVTATEKVLPQLKDKILSFSYRIPTAIVASSDITLQLKNTPNNKELENFLRQKIEISPYVRANDESLTSIDYEKEEYSAICDMQWLKVENGLIKVVLWYDNEWGYSCRVLDLINCLKQHMVPTPQSLDQVEALV